jgi:hypothetical protein
LLLAVEDETGDMKTADAAEMRVIQEMRQTGKVVLQSQIDKTSQEIKQTAGVWSEGKNSAGTPPLETSASTRPIGSGEIESTHRYIVQQRLKLPGAWWRTQRRVYAGVATQSRKPTVGQLLAAYFKKTA